MCAAAGVLLLCVHCVCAAACVLLRVCCCLRAAIYMYMCVCHVLFQRPLAPPELKCAVAGDGDTCSELAMHGEDISSGLGTDVPAFCGVFKLSP